MTDADKAFDRLRAINPTPETSIRRPDAASFVAALDEEETGELGVVPTTPPRSNGRMIWAGALACVATLVIVLGLWSALARDTDPDVVTDLPEESTTTAAPTTTEPPPTTIAPTTNTEPTTLTDAPEIDAETRALLDRFETTYNAGDPDAFLALLQPGMDREVIVDRDRRLYAQEYLRELYLVDVALHTELTLDCEARSGSPTITCVPTRYDDLHRVLDIPGTEDYDWFLVFDEDGLVRSWSERRENQPGIDNYEREAYLPFASWAFENHPDVVEGGLKPAVAAEWIVSKRDDIVAMVALFAESRGVALEG